MKYLGIVSLSLLFLIAGSTLWGGQWPSEASLDSRFAKINVEYKLSVKPIFAKSCLNCHGIQTDFPWYSKIPGIKFMIDHDISKAHVTIDMSKDYPFIGRGTPEEFLEAISDVIEDKSMPPWRYRIMHRDSALSQQERDVILKWAQQSKDLLTEDAKKNNSEK
jgi:hypothetical protein